MKTRPLLAYASADAEMTWRLARLLCRKEEVRKQAQRLEERFQEDGIFPLGAHDRRLG